MDSIEDRIAKLENAVFGYRKAWKKDWEATVGRFKSDPFVREIVDDALMCREVERRQAGFGEKDETRSP